MRVINHNKIDWCYLCGNRWECLDMSYSKNAENYPDDESKYFRICKWCIKFLFIEANKAFPPPEFIRKPLIKERKVKHE